MFDTESVNLAKQLYMQAMQQPSTFAQIIDKLRDKSEEELKQLYLQLSTSDLIDEWKNLTENAVFGNAAEEDIVKAIQKKRYKGIHESDY